MGTPTITSWYGCEFKYISVESFWFFRPKVFAQANFTLWLDKITILDSTNMQTSFGLKVFCWRWGSARPKHGNIAYEAPPSKSWRPLVVLWTHYKRSGMVDASVHLSLLLSQTHHTIHRSLKYLRQPISAFHSLWSSQLLSIPERFDFSSLQLRWRKSTGYFFYHLPMELASVSSGRWFDTRSSRASRNIPIPPKTLSHFSERFDA